MTYHWDELSKSLAEDSLPRRQSLRLLGAAIAGAIFSPLASGTAWGAGRDPCKDFCHCSNRKQQSDCLAACRACNSNPTRLCGTCGSYACTDLANDIFNCGACGRVCEEPGPYEQGACLGGECVYACAEGAVSCSGGCTSLDWDPDNCGACGNLCPESAPYCNQGVCSECSPGLAPCGDSCVDLASDPANCGACGNVCGGATPYCTEGVCSNCGGYGAAFCNGRCINILSDNANCGACGVQCAADEICTFGVCYGTCSGC